MVNFGYFHCYTIRDKSTFNLGRCVYKQFNVVLYFFVSSQLYFVILLADWFKFISVWKGLHSNTEVKLPECSVTRLNCTKRPFGRYQKIKKRKNFQPVSLKEHT